MKDYEKEVERAKLKAEEKELKHLRAIYNKAADDIAEKLRISNGKINVLLKDYDDLDDVQKSILQSQIYQRNFQLSLKKQIDGFLADLQKNQYSSIDDYLKKSYDTGFLGSVYSLHKQGIPLVFPVDQKKAAAAIKLDPKISKNLYTKLGEDVAFLKKRIANNLSRGIATADSYSHIARNIAADSNVGFNRAMRIARTEGHRIQAQSAFDAQHKAKEKGADVVKQWDAALDKRTRESHARVDGEIRELDEKFSNGLMYPGDSKGGAAEVVNCRCALLQRAKWALDEDELEELKKRAEYYGLDKAENFEDFKKKYLKIADEAEKAPLKAFSFTADEEKALEWYVSGEGQWINQYLRGSGDFGNLSDNEEELLRLLESATDRPLADDITKLYRAVDAKAVFGDIDYMQWERLQGGLLYNNQSDLKKSQALLDGIKGKTITEKGFMSTSKEYDVVADWGDFTGAEMPIVLEFDVPKGLKGADLFKFDVEDDEQFEVLLARNTKYQIKDISVKDGNIYLKAELSPENVASEATSKAKRAVESAGKIMYKESEKLDTSNFSPAFTTKSEVKNTQKLVDYVNNIEGANPAALKLYNSIGKLEKYEEMEVEFKISHAKGHSVETRGFRSGELTDVKLTIPKLSGENLAGQVNTTLHENMHLIDLMLKDNPDKMSGKWFSAASTSMVNTFAKTDDSISDEIKALFEAHDKEYKAISDKLRELYNQEHDKLVEKYLPNGVFGKDADYKGYQKEQKKLHKKILDEQRDYESRNIMGGGIGNLQDIYDALSGGTFRDNGTVKYGHGSKYYRNSESRIHETIANYGALSVTRPDLIEMLKRDKPELVDALDKVIDEMIKKVDSIE